MYAFASMCDDFAISARLLMKMELDPSREALLHFFEQIRKARPVLRRFRRREDGSVVLDSDGGEPTRQSVRIEPFSIRYSCGNPADGSVVAELGKLVFGFAPAQLSLSDLNFDFLEVGYTFDLEYRGNHDELIAETLFADHPLGHVLAIGAQRIIDCQPMIGVALTNDCSTQAFLEIKSRTSTLEVRTDEFENNALTVNLLVRRYWMPDSVADLLGVHNELLALGESLAGERVVPQVVQPLAAAIASRL